MEAGPADGEWHDGDIFKGRLKKGELDLEAMLFGVNGIGQANEAFGLEEVEQVAQRVGLQLLRCLPDAALFVFQIYLAQFIILRLDLSKYIFIITFNSLTLNQHKIDNI